MTVPQRVQRHRKTEANRRRVTTRGKRAPRPRAPRPPARRPKYRKSAALGGLSGMFGALFLATGQILWAVGAVAQATGAAAAAYVDYRRDLIEVKRTGRPIGTPDPAKPSRAGDPLQPGDPKPVDLDAAANTRTRPAPQQRAKPKPGQHGPPGHEAKCTAKTKEACPYWRKANPTRTRKTTTTRKRTK